MSISSGGFWSSNRRDDWQLRVREARRGQKYIAGQANQSLLSSSLSSSRRPLWTSSGPSERCQFRDQR